MRLPLGLPCGGSQLTCTLEPEAAKPAQTAAHLQWIALVALQGLGGERVGVQLRTSYTGCLYHYVLV